MFEQINEPIEVVVRFAVNQALPVKFLWPARQASQPRLPSPGIGGQVAGVAGGHGREVIITKINLTYSKRDGRDKFYYFAVTDGANYFKLQFNTENLLWTLLETYVE